MKKILVVDDASEIRHLVRATLGDEFKIYEAINGSNAVEFAKKYVPDLIIMDLVMPGEIDGIEATHQIKANPKTSNCQVLILTGLQGSVRKQEGLDAGASDFINKPFSPLGLLEKIEALLRLNVC